MTDELRYALDAVKRAGNPQLVSDETKQTEYANGRRILSIARGVSRKTDGQPMAHPVRDVVINPNGDLSDEY